MKQNANKKQTIKLQQQQKTIADNAQSMAEHDAVMAQQQALHAQLVEHCPKPAHDMVAKCKVCEKQMKWSYQYFSFIYFSSEDITTVCLDCVPSYIMVVDSSSESEEPEESENELCARLDAEYEADLEAKVEAQSGVKILPIYLTPLPLKYCVHSEEQKVHLLNGLKTMCGKKLTDMWYCYREHDALDPTCRKCEKHTSFWTSSEEE